MVNITVTDLSTGQIFNLVLVKGKPSRLLGYEFEITPSAGTTRKPVDPLADQAILDRIVKNNEPIKDIAADLKISRQSVHKAANRAKKRLAASIVTGPQSHTNIEDLMAIARLLGWKRGKTTTKKDLILWIEVALQNL